MRTLLGCYCTDTADESIQYRKVNLLRAYRWATWIAHRLPPPEGLALLEYAGERLAEEYFR